jgi:hypothetical protein
MSPATAASIAGGGVAGVLPEPASRDVRHLIEATTPFEFRDPAGGRPVDSQPDGNRSTTTDRPPASDSIPTSETTREAPGTTRGPTESGRTPGHQATNGNEHHQQEQDKEADESTAHVPDNQERRRPTTAARRDAIETTVSEPAETEPAHDEPTDGEDPAVARGGNQPPVSGPRESDDVHEAPGHQRGRADSDDMRSDEAE